MRKTDDAGVELIKSFEALRLKAYQDSVGVWTIGWGHTAGVKRGQVITTAQAEQFLRDDLGDSEEGVENALTEDVTDNQFAACVSLAFNIGVSAFRKSSIVKFINAGDVQLAADRFLLYNKAGGKPLAGLTRRRKAERALYLTEDEPTEQATLATSTTTTTTTEAAPDTPKVTTVEEKTSLISSITGNEKAKEIAGTGLTTIGNKLATGGISGGLLSAIGAFLEKAWPVLIFAAVLIILGFATWMLIYHSKQQQKVLEAQIAADPKLHDVVIR